MDATFDYITLVRQAQRGDKVSLSRLAQGATERLRTDVYRLTMRHDLTEDIVQETILEMFKILSELREADRFWPWLYKIALNKLRNFFRKERRRKTVPISPATESGTGDDGEEVISNAVTQELKQIVFTAMRSLKPQQRAVITMRCYREMEYAVIGESLG